MQDTENPKLRKLKAALSSAHAMVALLEAEIADLTVGTSGDDPLLTTKQLKAEFGVSHDFVAARAKAGELAASRGPHGKLLVLRSEMKRYLMSTPVQPRKTAPASSLDDWDVQATRALRGDRSK